MKFLNFKRLKNLLLILVLINLYFLFYSFDNKKESTNCLTKSVKYLKNSHRDKPSKIFCLILTTTNKLKNNTYFNILFTEWVQKCDDHRFILRLEDNSNRIENNEYNGYKLLQPAGDWKEVYSKLTDKVFYMLKDTYLHNNEFDWYLKADDDTFVFMNNLRTFLKNKNSSVPIDFGYDLKIFGKNPLKNIWPQTYHSGGAGYVLSKEALNRIGSKLNENYEYCENTGSEDADVGRCLRRLNVDSCKSIDKLGRERFLPINILEFVSQMGPDRSSKWYYKWLYFFSKNTVQPVNTYLFSQK